MNKDDKGHNEKKPIQPRRRGEEEKERKASIEQELESYLNESMNKVAEWQKRNKGSVPDPVEDDAAGDDKQFNPIERQSKSADGKSRNQSDGIPIQPSTSRKTPSESKSYDDLKRERIKAAQFKKHIGLHNKTIEQPSKIIVVPAIYPKGFTPRPRFSPRKITEADMQAETSKESAGPSDAKPNQPSDLDTDFDFDKSLQLRSPVERNSSEIWMELEIGAEYEVFVSCFGSCSSFFIQVINEEDQWDETMIALDEIKVLQPMADVAVGKLCLVESDGDLNRAKIIRHSERSTLCFCVDSAELVYFHNEPVRIYELPQDILKMMPFQAVNCCLIGINAPSDFLITSLIYKKIVMRICKQRIRVMKKLDRNPEMIPWGLENVNCYEVELFSKDDNGKETAVNDLVVSYQLADYN